MDKIISGKNIVKSFDNNANVNVLDNVSVEIAKGEFTAVMGPSGSGKSTLLFALSGMDNINSGSVMFNDIELSNLNDRALADIRRTKMGFVFQQPTMLKNLNILDNIILPAVQNNKKDIAAITTKAKSLMSKTGIEGLEERDTSEVSGGQLQRAGICRALMNSPEIIFADEPTGALNSKASEEIMELFSKINSEGTAVLIVTHDAKVAARANRVLFTKDGKVVSDIFLKDSHSMDARLKKVSENMAAVGI